MFKYRICMLSFFQGGILVLVGIQDPSFPEFPLGLALFRGIKIEGNYVGSLEQNQEILQLLKDGKVMFQDKIIYSVPVILFHCNWKKIIRNTRTLIRSRFLVKI